MEYETFKSLTALQSLAWTFPVVILSFAVLWEIRKPSNELFLKLVSRNELSKDQKKMLWIFFGFFFAFTGKIVESIWWAIPWTLHHIEHPRWFEFNSFGVFFNILFRQFFFTSAAYCHLRAFTSPEKNGPGLKSVHWVLGLSLIMGQLYAITLLLIKPL